MNRPLPRISQRSGGEGAPEGDRQGAQTDLNPYVSRFVAGWLAEMPDRRHRSVDATLLFADISGFTALTERLAGLGTIGAEQLSDTIDYTFDALLTAARDDGADLLKWGGDAVVLLFRGDEHPAHAARAAHRMRATLRDLVRRHTLPVRVALKISMGVHSGSFDMFLVGDPSSHRELIIAGAAATELVEMERVADAGQIVLSAAAMAHLPETCRGAAVPDTSPGARLLRSCPSPGPSGDAQWLESVDVGVALPPMIRDLLEEGVGESEHRPVAVAFVQVSGTDAVLRDDGAGAATAAIEEVVRNVQLACLTHEVTFFESDIAHDGGKIMLTAGAPRSTGDDSERLLRTARDIVDRAGVLPLRIGANRGAVFSGGFGPAFRRTYSVKGDAVNLAARLAGRAAVGEVLATDDLVSRSRTEVHADRLPPFPVKGKRHPVEALRVLGLVEGRAAVRLEAPFTGRRAELDLVRSTVLGALRRNGSVVDISGPPGIGKSRLVAELTPLPDDLVVLLTACSDYDSSTSWFAFRTVLRDLFGIRPGDDGEQVLARLAQRVGADAPRLVPWLPLLAPMLSVELPDTPQTKDIDPRFRRRRLEEVALELFRVALPTPTLLVFEDAHLLDEASAALLRRLLAETTSRPWSVVLTRRDVSTGTSTDVVDDLVAGAGGAHIVSVPLGPLSDEAAVDLVEALAGDAHLGMRAIEAMADRAAGNPLFLTSLAGVARHDGVPANLPASIEGAYLRELDRLSPHRRTLLRYAAVIGVRFDPKLLAALVPDADGETSVEDLEDFLELLDDGTMQFRHVLLRDVAYDGLPFRLRRTMHARVGRLLELEGGPAADRAVLARHFHAAGLHRPTWTHSLAAGEHAAASYSYRDAADHFARALEAVAHLPEVTDEARATAYVRLGESRDMAGQSAAAIEAYRAARALRPDDPVGRARLMYRQARIDLRRGRHPQALRMLTRALHTVGDRPGRDADGVRAELATRYGFCRHLQGRATEALRWARTGARWAEASGDEAVLAHAYNALHLAYGASREDEDRPYGRLALAAYERLGDLGGQALCENNLAIDDFRAGRWSEAAVMFERAASTFRRLGDEANEGNVTYNLADVHVSRGRFEESLPVLRRALRLARGVDDEELVALALREGARAYAALGDTDRAWALFAEARAKLVDLHLPIETALLDAAHAEALVASGRVEDGIRLAETAGEQAVTERLTEALPRLHRVRASALLAAGRAAEALDHAERGLTMVGGAGDGYDRALLRLARAEALTVLDRATEPERARLRADAHSSLRRLGVVRVVGVGPAAQIPAAQIPPRTSRKNSTTR